MRTTPSEITTGVEERIRRFFAARAEDARTRNAGHALLWRRIADAADGGKRLRSRLVLLAHDHLGGGDRRSAETAGAAFELLHTALLLHDDVLDGDLIRRGRPNLAGLFTSDAIDAGRPLEDATAWGTASAMLAGDLLISGAHALVSELRDPIAREMHRAIDDALFDAVAGEHADVGAARGMTSPSSGDIILTMAQKTATYSCAAPLRAGAIIAGAHPGTVAALQRIGSELGVLYQLRDDVLGVFGAESRTGKSITGDLREGKRTLLIAYAEQTPEWHEVRHLFGRVPLDETDAARLRDALIASGAAERMQGAVAEQLDRTRREIDLAPVPAVLRDALSGIARMCAERQA
ncbi:polyprenyl synthetase family protein [Microbacterium bovistercoris]|uniref:Polyprenyl synthetase family protein n=1 Tax=Microbacterium bovistercoris TaxID=2293570 RepID=A0A371NQ30_9MICO|nr:polyprenyl synthetase family protein [Microbacterium bovistercoris]REJ04284.1 polyprenyl synthetase family protein [Microbacterium bovistercoris]